MGDVVNELQAWRELAQKRIDKDECAPLVILLTDKALALQRENAALRARYEFPENQRLCVGYEGGCDGDLTATQHEEGCPAREKDVQLRPHLYAARASAQGEKGNGNGTDEHERLG